MVRESAVYRDNGVSHGRRIVILNLFYATLGLTGEAGEVANKVKKIHRDDGDVVTEKKRMEILGELGGVAWYLTAIAQELGATLEEVFSYNYDQITDRLERGVIQGSGDNR
jgi:NTP pyrophosphatase (non-canonical NTP hydrolase)